MFDSQPQVRQSVWDTFGLGGGGGEIEEPQKGSSGNVIVSIFGLMNSSFHAPFYTHGWADSKFRSIKILNLKWFLTMCLQNLNWNSWYISYIHFRNDNALQLNGLSIVPEF